MSTRVLYTSADVHSAIKEVFVSPKPGEERYMIVAYVGASAEAFLPHPKGLHVVCALEPGATSAHALIRLRDRGAKIEQARGLHSKVYWSSERGAVICSANASKNALGKGGLKEAGIWVPKGGVDIQRLLRYVKPKPITNEDLKALGRRADLINRSVTKTRGTQHGDCPSLQEWLLHAESYRDWKLSWCNDQGRASKAAKAEAESSYGVREPDNLLDVKEREMTRGDWVLIINLSNWRSLYWMFVDFVVKVPKSDKRAYSKDYPYQAVQATKNSEHSNPPFMLDRSSRALFISALKDFGEDKITDRKTAKVPARFLELLQSKVRGRAD